MSQAAAKQIFGKYYEVFDWQQAVSCGNDGKWK